MDAQLFIQKVAAGEAADAKDTLTDMLSSKAFESLDARKQEIARTLYGENLDVEVQDTADSEVEEDELLTQEEFIALSEEDQELYLEALEQLDEDKKLEAIAKKQLAHIPGKLYKAADGAYYKNHKGKSHISNPAVGSKTSAPRSYSSSNDDDDAVAFQKRDRAGIKLSHDDFIGSGYGGGGGALSYDRKRNRVREEVEELDEISQKTAVKAYSARLGREDDDTGPTKSMKTMDRIHKKYGAKGVMRAATAADNEHGIHSLDYTKKDFVGDYLSSKK